MERQRIREEEIPKKVREESEKKLEELRKELAELRERKKQKESMEKQASEIVAAIQEKEVSETEDTDYTGINDIEARLDNIDKYLLKQFDVTDQKTYAQHAEYIESELQSLEEEIIEQKGHIEKEVSPFEIILQEYPWVEEKRFEYMYTIPDKKKHPNDFESWKIEWAKVLFDYAKYAILHILYIRKLNSEKPFSKFTNRESSIKEIAEELIEQKLAKWINKKKKEKLRVYWKTLEGWAKELYNWAYDLGKLEPIMIYEIVEAKMEFSTLPKEDLEEVFKILAKGKRASVIKLDDGQLAVKIKLD